MINTQYDLWEKYIEQMLSIDTCCSQGSAGEMLIDETTFSLANKS
jgi:hypothetical protein